MKYKNNWNEAEIRKAKMFVRSISHPLRRKIIDLISNEKLITNDELWRRLQAPQPVVSQHTKILIDVGIIDFEKQGKWHILSINTDRLELIKKAVSIIAK